MTDREEELKVVAKAAWKFITAGPVLISTDDEPAKCLKELEDALENYLNARG